MMLQQSELKSIRNILTLRYDPEERPGILHKSWMDWNPTQSDPQGKTTEDILNFYIVNELMDYDRIGISLSSGVDSSLLLSLIRDAFPEKKIIAFHYTGVNNDELAGAEKLSMQYEAELKILKPSPVIERIPFMIKMMNSPKWDCYDYVIPEAAKKENCDILVTGDGSDELYAGYTFRYEKFEQITSGRTNWHPIDEQISAYLACHNHDFVSDQEDLFPNNHDHTKFSFPLDIHPYFYPIFKSPLDLMQKLILADYNGKLCHNFTVKQNKFAEHFDISIFSPFLGPDVKNFATHIPLREKYHNGIGKLPLRAICKRQGINPPQKKLGFTHDIKSEWQAYRDSFLELIFDPHALIYELGIINFKWMAENAFKTEERIINKLVSLYTLEKYLQWKNN